MRVPDGSRTASLWSDHRQVRRGSVALAASCAHLPKGFVCVCACAYGIMRMCKCLWRVSCACVVLMESAMYVRVLVESGCLLDVHRTKLPYPARKGEKEGRGTLEWQLNLSPTAKIGKCCPRIHCSYLSI